MLEEGERRNTSQVSIFMAGLLIGMLAITILYSYQSSVGFCNAIEGSTVSTYALHQLIQSMTGGFYGWMLWFTGKKTAIAKI